MKDKQAPLNSSTAINHLYPTMMTPPGVRYSGLRMLAGCLRSVNDSVSAVASLQHQVQYYIPFKKASSDALKIGRWRYHFSANPFFWTCLTMILARIRILKGGSYGNKILYKNLDLTQDFPNKISFHFLWVKMLPKNLPKIFRWPEMCPLDKILAQDFQMAAFTKILGRRDISVVPLLSTENCKTLFHTACMAVTSMQR